MLSLSRSLALFPCRIEPPRLAAATSLLLSSALLVGCPPAESGGESSGDLDAGGSALPRQATPCSIDFPADYPATRTLEIGAGAGADFAPWGPGQKVPLYHGNQGLEMTTPALRVPALDGDPASTCLRVRIENDYQGAIAADPQAMDALQTTAPFLRQGSFLITDGAVYNAFSFSRDELTGVDVAVTATVQGPGYSATTAVTITLE